MGIGKPAGGLYLNPVGGEKSKKTQSAAPNKPKISLCRFLSGEYWFGAVRRSVENPILQYAAKMATQKVP
jgi:hypothetical protein